MRAVLRRLTRLGLRCGFARGHSLARIDGAAADLGGRRRGKKREDEILHVGGGRKLLGDHGIFGCGCEERLSDCDEEGKSIFLSARAPALVVVLRPLSAAFTFMPRHLFYTLALDHPPGAVGHRNMAKLLVLSLLRTRSSGDIVVFKNSAEPLFMVPRAGVREVLVATEGPEDAADFWDYAQRWKFRVAEQLEVRGYDKVFFLDADCLALRSLDTMLEGDWDIGYYSEPGSRAASQWFGCFISDEEGKQLDCEGVNGGLIAVRAELYHEVMAHWGRVFFGPSPQPKYFTDQGALTRLVIDTRLRRRPFSREHVAAPFSYDLDPQVYFRASLVHLAGCNDFYEKLRFMFGLYMNTFFFDQRTTLLHILEF